LVFFVIDDPSTPGLNTSLYKRGGGLLMYSGFNASTGAFAPEYYHRDILVRTSDSSYERNLSDGFKERFTLVGGTIGQREFT